MNDPSRMQTRPIPSSGEPLGVIGLGTYVGFDVRQGSGVSPRLQQVLHALFEPGGSVIDSSPMYGNAEAVTGDLLSASAPKQRPFLATKVWTRGEQAGIAQMNRSMELLHTGHIDLMQVHNLLDWRVHLKTMRQWKEAGRIACTSWAQLLLKFVISHPAVTCAIPGTARPEHMAENAAAGIGPLADHAQRERIDCDLRVKAAKEIGSLNGTPIARRMQLGMQLRIAMEDAIQQYSKRNFPPALAEKKESNTTTFTMTRNELDTMAWLADCGFRMLASPSDTYRRTVDRLSYKEAAAYLPKSRTRARSQACRW